MAATVAVRFKLHKGLAERRSFRAPYFSHPGYFADPEGHVWEVAWNPNAPLSEAGEFRWNGYG